MNELVNVKAEKINNEIESLNQNEIMEEVKRIPYGVSNFVEVV